MYSLRFIHPRRAVLAFPVESIDILTVNAWPFLERICHCSFVLYCYQRGRNTANYCNYYSVTAVTVETNTNFEKRFIHPFCQKLLKVLYCWPVTLQNMIESLRNKRCTFSLSYCWGLSAPITVRGRHGLLASSMQ